MLVPQTSGQRALGRGAAGAKDPGHEEKKPKRLGSVQPNFSSVWHTGLSGGALDCPVRQASLQ